MQFLMPKGPPFSAWNGPIVHRDQEEPGNLFPWGVVGELNNKYNETVK